MEITWFGQSCFLIKSKQIRIVTDPFSPEIGLRLPSKLKADIVTISHEHFDHNYVDSISPTSDEQKPFIIREPGEYEIQNIEIVGVATFHDNQKGNLRGRNIVYTFHLEEMGLCHLGDLGHTLSDEELEMLNQIDILLVPTGGNYTINAKKAVEVVNQIEPKIIIPMHYQIEGLAPSIQLDPIDDFLKEMGVEATPLDSLKISKAELPEEERKVVILKRRI